jgi:hypothetical protein
VIDPLEAAQIPRPLDYFTLGHEHGDEAERFHPSGMILKHLGYFTRRGVGKRGLDDLAAALGHPLRGCGNGIPIDEG